VKRSGSRGGRTAACAALLAAALFAGGCATVNIPPNAGQNPADPWEALNRRIFAFNDALDKAILEPVATAYRDAVPELMRRGVDNFFGNIGDAWSTVNHLLQGKLESALTMGTRFVVNSLMGLGGILDPASEMKLTRHSEDFGQTLGRWGVGPGPYIVWPLFGPRTVRDSFGMVLDWQFEPNRIPQTESGRWATSALMVVNTRTNLLNASSLLNAAALDRYSFLRDAYLARRLDQIYDGAPPLEPMDDDSDDASKPKTDPPKK
jgi:phospholipid-binding lipoprotein MlaA